MTSYPELFQSVYDRFFDLLSSSGVPEKTAETVAMEAVDTIHRDFGGMTIYFPKHRNIGPSKRDMEIYRRFDGKNRNQICHEFGLSTPRMYQIIQSVREEIKKKQNVGTTSGKEKGRTSR